MSSATHCAIYLHDGLIIEAGSAPKNCIKEIGQFNTYFGISSLTDFKKFAKETRKSPVWKVITEKDSKKTEIINRLRRAKKMIGFQHFTMFSSNCVQTTNYITFGKHQWSFPENVSTEII
jgi:ADP-heptose:LPS heptosyltransferase